MIFNEIFLLEDQNNDIIFQEYYPSFQDFLNTFHSPTEVLDWFKWNKKISFPAYRLNKDLLLQFPDDFLKYLIGNCVDHSLFMHLFCFNKNIEHKIGFITFSDTHKVPFTFILQHAFPMFKYYDKWFLWNFMFNLDGKVEMATINGPYDSVETVENDLISILSRGVDKQYIVMCNHVDNEEMNSAIDSFIANHYKTQDQFLRCLKEITNQLTLASGKIIILPYNDIFRRLKIFFSKKVVFDITNRYKFR